MVLVVLVHLKNQPDLADRVVLLVQLVHLVQWVLQIPIHLAALEVLRIRPVH